MTSIARLRLEIGPPDLWGRLVFQAQAWLRTRGLALRDAVVLLPYAQALPEARRAFARGGVWMPRVETTHTLAAGLGPPPVAAPGQISFDATLDALSAAALLRSRPWGMGWAQRDPRGFDQAVAALVATAHALVRAAAAVAPEVRAAHWTLVRERLAPLAGPGATERLLARVALEWASLAPPPATDRLFRSPPPAAWIVVRAGGIDPLAETLASQGLAPALVVDTDPPEEALFGPVLAGTAPSLAVCDGFEQEAQAAAAQVWVHASRGETPVALVAEDRLLVRRVRALLERQGLRLLDETGWKLSTTRAAAAVMGLIESSRPDASTDTLLDWLKAGTQDETALEALEGACRRHPIRRVAGLNQTPLEGPAQRLWTVVSPVLAAFGRVGRQPLTDWLVSLTAALEACGLLRVLQRDDAGARVLAELRLARPGPASDAWTAGAGHWTLDAGEFRRWVDEVLERAMFRPAPAFEGPADVVVTPLAQTVLRPFAAAVLAGADASHLGRAQAPPGLIGDALAGELGLPTAAERRLGEALAFGHLLSLPRVTLSRRRADGNEPLAESPLLERLELALAAVGKELRPWDDPREVLAIEPAPVLRSAPVAPELLPSRLSASACEALRACPYRFYALYMLRLREDDELEREIDKRDYGTWLHAVLHAFHVDRHGAADPATEVARLHELALSSRASGAMSDADFLPYAASFESFAPRYVAWLHRRDAAGVRWLRGEEETVLRLESLGGTDLRGIIDRVDARGAEPGAPIDVIDYKTGGSTGLRDKVRRPYEDTQLAFYAALSRAQTDAPIRAFYLALDDTKGLKEVEHPDVETSAAVLLEGLSTDLERLREGAGLPPLGSGSTCDHCSARGVCRRDHWNDA